MKKKSVLFVLLTFALVFSAFPVLAQGNGAASIPTLGQVGTDASLGVYDTIYTPRNNHGTKIYISPSDQIGNVGCGNFNEAIGAINNATRIKDYLVARGYIVRIGAGTFQNKVANSNAWGSDLHMPLHSNASADGVFDCDGSNSARGGSLVMYSVGDAVGEDYSQTLLDATGPVSPGTTDYIATDVQVTGGTLYELRVTTVPAAYMEVAFHTYAPDVAWLSNSTDIGNTLGLAIQNIFGLDISDTVPTNRLTGLEGAGSILSARTEQVQAADGSLMDVAVVQVADEPTFAQADFGYDVAQFGQVNAALEADVQAYLSEYGLDKGLLGQIVVEGNTAVVDFTGADVVTSLTKSLGKYELNLALQKLIFADPQIDEIYFQLNGSNTAWTNWMEFTTGPAYR